MVGARRMLGDAAEDAAVEYLTRQGYRIRARNFLCRYGELDIVAQRGDICCFVEVRMRSTAAWGDPSQTVSFGKQRRVVKAALHYLFRHDLHDFALRFDVISVVGHGRDAKVDHIPNAFDAGM
ncbi:MAG: YraN family protein [Myxococcaceae bacterium]